ncbi:carbon storage regulator [Shewanella sp. 10N.286.48.A6]|uniref:carbon storage regulator n=1 Tax=Shewanella sp. 10N.286.48.A6 TaxID=1880833 RepID=UPI000C85EDCA|nr:carbon storage regulator [Shewanella sp. 10N.286.48.A6]PMH96291.1 hypothetical protein BCU55_19390 [Shewanella sp. 10N.286.48.A6]
MLYLTRQKEETLVLSGIHDAHGNLLDDVEIVIMSHNRIGIHADKKILVLRKELIQRYSQDGKLKTLHK